MYYCLQKGDDVVAEEYPGLSNLKTSCWLHIEHEDKQGLSLLQRAFVSQRKSSWLSPLWSDGAVHCTCAMLLSCGVELPPHDVYDPIWLSESAKYM